MLLNWIDGKTNGGRHRSGQPEMRERERGTLACDSLRCCVDWQIESRLIRFTHAACQCIVLAGALGPCPTASVAITDAVGN